MSSSQFRAAPVRSNCELLMFGECDLSTENCESVVDHIFIQIHFHFYVKN